MASHFFGGQIALFWHCLRALTIVALISLGVFAQAKEGFSSDLGNAPQAVKNAWDATFTLIYSTETHVHHGTAFLIQKKVIDNELVLLFLTVAHNIGDCKADGKICPHLTLIQNARLTETPTKMILDTLEGLRFDTVAARRINVEGLEDVAIVGASASLNDPRKIPEPLKLTDICDLNMGDRLYAVGYPSTYLRTNSKSLPIVNGDQVVKRWSQGINLGDWNYPGISSPLLASTIDDLEGLSGGPILDQRGLVVSLVRKGAKAEGNAYTGSEGPFQLKYQTLGPNSSQMKQLGANLGD